MSTNWKSAYQNILKETDRKKLTQYVHEMEGAIFDRMQELDVASSHHLERAEMEAAAQHLFEIKTRKLGWPNPCA